MLQMAVYCIVSPINLHIYIYYCLSINYLLVLLYKLDVIQIISNNISTPNELTLYDISKEMDTSDWLANENVL